MSITVTWYKDTRSVILMDFREVWGWQELVEAKQTCERLLDTVDKPCAILFHVPHLPPISRHLVGVEKGRILLSKRHSRAAFLLTATENTTLRAVSAALSRLPGMPAVLMLPSLEDSDRALIEQGYLPPQAS